MPRAVGADVKFRVLGPLEVLDGGRPLALGGAQQRALLGVLLVNRREVVSVDRLIDELWGEGPPPSAAKSVQVYVSRLRKLLGDGLLVTRGRGYELAIELGQVDVERFERLVCEARGAREHGDHRRAAQLLREALGLWRGPPLADFTYQGFAAAAIARLEEARLGAVEDLIDARLATEEHAALVAELQGLVRDHPLRERLRGQLMLALYRCGRQADALEAYRGHGDCSPASWASSRGSRCGRSNDRSSRTTAHSTRHARPKRRA